MALEILDVGEAVIVVFEGQVPGEADRCVESLRLPFGHPVETHWYEYGVARLVMVLDKLIHPPARTSLGAGFEVEKLLSRGVDDDGAGHEHGIPSFDLIFEPRTSPDLAQVCFGLGDGGEVHLGRIDTIDLGHVAVQVVEAGCRWHT